jgi:Domain of unknown function (DUF1707)
MSPAPEPRIGDAERDVAIKALGEHYAAGRLTKEEYDERADVALRARFDSDLRHLFLDLPRTGPGMPSRGSYQPGVRRGPSWRHSPLVPLLTVAVVVIAVANGPWWLLLILGWLWWCRPHRHWR